MLETHGDSLETKNMIPAAKERLNLSKVEKCAKDRMPAMMPAKHDIPARIMNARVAFQYTALRFPITFELIVRLISTSVIVVYSLQYIFSQMT